MRRLALLLLIVGLGWGCGHSYEDANRAIVADLPKLDGVELLDEGYHEFCSSDSCPLGNDRSEALLVYLVDSNTYTQTSLVDAYRSALVDWTSTIEDPCGVAASCDEAVMASFTRGDARIVLNFDNWSTGQFELYVDAEGAT